MYDYDSSLEVFKAFVVPNPRTNEFSYFSSDISIKLKLVITVIRLRHNRAYGYRSISMAAVVAGTRTVAACEAPKPGL